MAERLRRAVRPMAITGSSSAIRIRIVVHIEAERGGLAARAASSNVPSRPWVASWRTSVARDRARGRCSARVGDPQRHLVAVAASVTATGVAPC